MTWQDQLRKATFRGVPFSVEAHETAVGRRTVTHEYPLRDKPFVEDLGRKARTLSIDAFVFGADYMAARDRLIQVFEQAGPGTLVHPYLGELTVSILDVKIRESTAEGGMARLSIALIESGEATFPNQVVNSSGAVRTAATAAEGASKAAFLECYAVEARPEFVANAAGTILNDAMNSIENATRAAGMASTEVAGIVGSVRSVTQNLITNIYAPASAAQALVSNIKALIGAVSIDPLRALQLGKTFFSFGSGYSLVPLSDREGQAVTSSRLQQAENQRAMVGLVRQQAIIEVARVSTEVEFASFQDAATVRTDLADAIDSIAESGVSDDVYDSLLALRAAVVREITARGANLARVVRYTPNATIPALVLSYSLYGDAERDVEVVARNGIRHPGFVAGGSVLEVLSDAA